MYRACGHFKAEEELIKSTEEGSEHCEHGVTPVVMGYPMPYLKGDDGLGKWGVCSAFILS